MYFLIFFSVVVVSFISLVGIVALSWNETFLRRSVFLLVALAVGALLGDAFIHLIPEAFEESKNIHITALLMIFGVLLFFVFEKFLHWHHTHGEITEKCTHPVGQIVLFSDGAHNFLDGVIIAISFLSSVEVGIATTIAIILHEIPQEIGDFGVLIHAGFSKSRALVFNFISACTAIFGALLAIFFGNFIGGLVVWMLPIAAGGFIYIAGSDLIPELQKITRPRGSIAQFAMILFGVFLMYFLTFL